MLRRQGALRGAAIAGRVLVLAAAAVLVAGGVSVSLGGVILDRGFSEMAMSTTQPTAATLESFVGPGSGYLSIGFGLLIGVPLVLLAAVLAGFTKERPLERRPFIFLRVLTRIATLISAAGFMILFVLIVREGAHLESLTLRAEIPRPNEFADALTAIAWLTSFSGAALVFLGLVFSVTAVALPPPDADAPDGDS